MFFSKVQLSKIRLHALAHKPPPEAKLVELISLFLKRQFITSPSKLDSANPGPTATFTSVIILSSTIKFFKRGLDLEMEIPPHFPFVNVKPSISEF